MINVNAQRSTDHTCISCIELTISSIAPVLESLSELLLLPPSLRWPGKTAFSIGAVSMLQDGRIRMRYTFLTHLCVPLAERAALDAQIPRIRSNLAAWLRLHNVAWEQVRFDAQSLRSAMTDGDLRFVQKAQRPGGSGYTAFLLPLSDDVLFDVAASEKRLLAHPGTGMLLQLMPDQWTGAEKQIISRYAAGASVPSASVDELLAQDVACFHIALWGRGASLAAQELIGARTQEMTEKACLNEQGLAALLLGDPWALHRRMYKTQRMAGLLSAQEVARAFRCLPLQYAQAPVHAELYSDTLSQFKEYLEEKIGSLTQSVEETNQRVEETNLRVDRIEQQADGALDRMTDLTQTVEDTNQRVDRLGEQTDGVFDRIGDLAQTVEETNQRVDKLGEQTDEAFQWIDDMSQTMEETNQRVDKLGQQTDEAFQWIDDMSQTMKDTNLRVDMIGQQTDEAIERIEDLEQRMDELERRVNLLMQDFELTKDEIAHLHKTIEQFSVLDQGFKKELLETIDGLAKQDAASCRQVLETTAHSVDAPLAGAMLGRIGVKSEQELLDLGMTQLQLTMLRYSAACLANSPLLEKSIAANDQSNYLCQVFFLNMLFERLTRDVFHDNIYVPYYRAYEGREPKPLAKTDLFEYCNGPNDGTNPQEWTRDHMCSRLASGVTFQGDSWASGKWLIYFDNMNLLRKARNSLHACSIPPRQAFAAVHLMLFSQPNSPCYILRSLQIGRSQISLTR